MELIDKIMAEIENACYDYGEMGAGDMNKITKILEKHLPKEEKLDIGDRGWILLEENRKLRDKLQERQESYIPKEGHICEKHLMDSNCPICGMFVAGEKHNEMVDRFKEEVADEGYCPICTYSSCDCAIHTKKKLEPKKIEPLKIEINTDNGGIANEIYNNIQTLGLKINEMILVLNSLIK